MEGIEGGRDQHFQAYWILNTIMWIGVSAWRKRNDRVFAKEKNKVCEKSVREREVVSAFNV